MILDDAGGSDYFALIGEGAKILKGLDENSSSFFQDISRLREILGLIGEKPAAAPAGFDLSGSAEAMGSLKAYAEGGLKELPAALQPFEAVVVSRLARATHKGDAAPFYAATDVTSEIIRTVTASASAVDAAKKAVFEHYMAQGVKIDDSIDAAALKARYTELKALIKAPIEEPEYVKWLSDMNALRSSVNEKMQALYAEKQAAFDAGNLDLEKELESKYGALFTDYYHTIPNEVSANRKAAWAKNEAQINGKIDAEIAPVGHKIINALMERSPVTQEQAEAWVKAQDINPAAIARLKKNGYPEAQVLKDMADCYRLTGGKLPPIRLNTNGSRRANAVGVGSIDSVKTINVDSDFNRTILFHEMAHHLEDDPMAVAASQGFLVKRRKSEKLHKLRKLSGWSSYKADEVAYEDEFINPYIGKKYDSDVTEVFAMGVQYLASPVDAALFAAKDPEMMAMITGYLLTDLTPAAKALNKFQYGAKEARAQKAQSKEDAYTDAVAILTSKVSITNDGWYDRISGDEKGDFDWFCLRGAGSDAKYIGSTADGLYKIFQGKFKNSQTRRSGKGYLVVGLSEPDVAIKKSGYSKAIPQSASMGNSLDAAKALIRFSQKWHSGNSVTLAAWDFESGVVRAAKLENDDAQ